MQHGYPEPRAKWSRAILGKHGFWRMGLCEGRTKDGSGFGGSIAAGGQNCILFLRLLESDRTGRRWICLAALNRMVEDKFRAVKLEAKLTF